MRQTLLDAFQFRHACKSFDATRKIDAADFDTILEAARLSPSSFGKEPWRFLVIQNPQLREKLKAVSWGAQGQLPTASHFVVILARTGQGTRHDSEYIDWHMREIMQLPAEYDQRLRSIYANFQQNEYKLLESERAIWDWAAKQCYIPMANMMTSAALLGIDSCPIEGFDPAAVTTLLQTELGIDPQQFRIATMVAFGYRASEPAYGKKRQTQQDLVQWA